MKKALRFTLAIILSIVLFQAADDRKKNIVSPSNRLVEEKHFTLVVPSYNNESYYKQNLDSIFSQTYDKYDVIYIDDASTDNTFSLVKEYLDKKGNPSNFKLIHNETNQKALYNLYQAIHSCPNDSIVVILDGDDWLKDGEVLSYLNACYQNPKVWLTYGEYERYPDGEIGISSAVKKSTLKRGRARKVPWKFSHLRTFYAGLFKKIRLEDFMFDGKFLDVTYDMAMMYPMIDMARTHAFYTPRINYVYNYDSPINDEKIRTEEQKKVALMLKNQDPYGRMFSDPREASEENHTADLIVFSYNRPMQLYSLLESVTKNITGLNETTIICRSDEQYDTGYAVVKKAFPNVNFVMQSKNGNLAKKNFRLNVLQAMDRGPSDYILFAVDDIIVTGDINLLEDIDKLEQTNAEGFYYRLGHNIDGSYSLNRQLGVPALTKLDDDCFVWEFENSTDEWNYPHTVDFTLYKKAIVRPQLAKIHYYHPNTLEGKWAEMLPVSRVGLCPSKSKMVNIPMNIVTDYTNRFADSFSQEELNAFFLEGKKIDIEAISRVEINTPHFDIVPTFVER